MARVHKNTHLSSLSSAVVSRQRNALAEDLLIILYSLSEDRPLFNLQFLYDEQYEDVMSVTSRINPSLISGRQMFQYDGRLSTVNQVLTSVSASTSAHSSVLLPLCSVKNITGLFRMIRRHRLESHRVDWLILLEEDEASKNMFLNSLEGLIHEGTRVAVVAREFASSNSSSTFLLYSSRPDVEGIVRFDEQGRWYSDPDRQVQPSQHSSLQHLLYPDEERAYLDLEKRQMLIGANDIEGMFGIDWRTDDNGVRHQEILGIDGAIIRSLGAALNFTYVIIRPDDGLWGNPLTNGTVTGIIGLTARREVDFSICAISVTVLRETVIDFTNPYIIEPFALFSRAPKEKNRVLAVLSPFTLQVWLLLLAATVVIGPILNIHSKMSYRLLKEEHSWELQVLSFNLFRSLVIQGNRLKASLWSQRVAVYSWYLFCLIVSALYSGMLTAVLAIPAFETPIDSLTDLPKAVENGFSIGILKDTANELLFREAKSGTFRETWLLFDHDDPPESFVPRPEIGIERVCETSFDALDISRHSV